MKKLKDVDYKIISELIKNCRISDRKLSKVVGVSQPTVSRKRAWLEKEELLNFTAVPNFSKFGFEIMAFSFYSWMPKATGELIENPEEITKKFSTFLSKHKNIIFTSHGRGLGMERMMISLHVSYSDYVRLVHDVEQVWGKYLHQSNSFVVSLKEDVVGRQFSFKSLGEYINENRTIF